MAEAARRDPLTGLFNVRAFHRALGEEIERTERTGSAFSLLMIDIDYLKRVNDRFGHLAGDRVLQQVAHVLADQVRGIDTVARYGGEEFAVLLPETGNERALVVAERLRSRVAASGHEELLDPVTISIGVATCPDDAVTPSDLLHKADVALYASKFNGRNRSTRFGSPGDEGWSTPPADEAPLLSDDSAIRSVRKALSGVAENRNLMRHLDVIAALANVMRARDPGAIDALRDISTITELFLAHLPLPERGRWTIHIACLLRDVGKLSISDAVLNKKDYLTREEYEIVRRHPIVGARIVEPLKGLDEAVPFIRHHHERWDGKGYPDGLAGNTIPYGARIVSLVDAFYAMIRSRPYADRARGLRYACEEIRRNSGTQFDPDLAQRFLDVVEANRDIIATLVDDADADEEGPVEAPEPRALRSAPRASPSGDADAASRAPPRLRPPQPRSQPEPNDCCRQRGLEPEGPSRQPVGALENARVARRRNCQATDRYRRTEHDGGVPSRVRAHGHPDVALGQDPASQDPAHQRQVRRRHPAEPRVGLVGGGEQKRGQRHGRRHAPPGRAARRARSRGTALPRTAPPARRIPPFRPRIEEAAPAGRRAARGRRPPPERAP